MEDQQPTIETEKADAVNADFERRRRLAPSPPLLSPPLPTSPRDFLSPTSPCSPPISSPRGQDKPTSPPATTSPQPTSPPPVKHSNFNLHIPKTKKLTHTITPPWIEKEEPPPYSKMTRAVSLPFPPMANEEISSPDTPVTIYYSGTSSEASNKQPFGGTSSTRESLCFIVREKVVVPPSKKGSVSSATYRNVVMTINMNGISLLHPFNETLICNYPYREIKLWKTYPSTFYFLWCPATARDGIPLLFETRQGDEILKAIHENVAKILEQRKKNSEAAATTAAASS